MYILDEDKDDIQYLFHNRPKEVKMELVLEWGSENNEDIIFKNHSEHNKELNWWKFSSYN